MLHAGATAFLGPPQRLLGPAPLGDIRPHPDHAGNRARRIPHGRVPRLEHRPEHLHGGGERFPGERPAHVRQRLRDVRVQLVHRSADQLGGPYSDRVECLPFDHREHAVVIEREQHERRARDHGAQPLLALTQGPLLPPPLGHIPRVDDQVRRAGGIHPGLPDRLQHAPRPVPVPEPELRRLGRVRPSDRAGQHEVERVPLEQLAGPIAEHALHRWARVAEHAVVAHDGDDVRGVLDQRAEMLLAAAQGIFGAGAVDRGREHVRHRLQEVRVVERELAAPAGVDPEHAERTLRTLDQHAQTADHAVWRQQWRAPEPRVGRQVLDHHRPGGPQRVAGVSVGIRRQDGAADAPVPPPQPGAQQQSPAFRAELEHTPEIGVQRPGGERHRRVHEVRDGCAGEGLLAEVRDRLLLSRGGTQRRFRPRQLRVARIVFGTQQPEARCAH